MPQKATPSNHSNNFFFKKLMPKFYGIGASIVILGAMFKLLNWPGGNLMLGIGLSTEAIIFFLSAFEPEVKELDWVKVYPELADNYQGLPRTANKSIEGSSISEKLDKMLAQAELDVELVGKLSNGMHRLSDSVIQMSSLADASLATDQFMKNLEKASHVMEQVYHANSEAAPVGKGLTSLSQAIQAYQTQIQGTTKNLQLLNTAYEKELQESTSRAELTKKAYAGALASMENIKHVGEETSQLKENLNKLGNSLAAINGVYSNMLNALKS